MREDVPMRVAALEVVQLGAGPHHRAKGGVLLDAAGEGPPQAAR
ncbi:hypothetical protein ABT390_04100 [Streptomyces aurantiacus]|nr:hypothetical protein [Streptomyces aurantiacus]